MLHDDNVDFGALARAIEPDPGLTLAVLHAANSALSASRFHIAHPRDAIIRVGLTATKRLVFAAVVGNAFADLGDCGVDLDAFWMHSLGAAILAEDTCTVRHLRPAAFSAGLLHDLGRLVLADSVPRAYPAIRQRAHDEAALMTAERAVFGEDHAAAGGRILALWGLPEEIAAVVGSHHEEPTSELARALNRGRSAMAALGYSDGFLDPTGGGLTVAPETAATLKARLQWYRSALSVAR